MCIIVYKYLYTLSGEETNCSAIKIGSSVHPRATPYYSETGLKGRMSIQDTQNCLVLLLDSVYNIY